MASSNLTKLQKYSAPALEKGLDILELLSLSDKELSLSQIAAGVGRSKNEIFRMMIVLEERQFISRAADDHYVLTDRLSVLGSNRSINNRIAEVAMPVLAELSEQVSLSCHLSVLDDDAVLVVAQAEATKGYSISVQVGHRSKVADSSARVCILTASQNTDATHSLSKLTEAPNPEFPGITELSAPVMGGQGDVVIAAITIPYMSAMISESDKESSKSHLLVAVELLQQRVKIYLPQL
ncbi:MULTISPECIES: IclR family transcriptional regulator [Falsihalocynthiibacter]|uniref:IclR family transcriptional regulator n=1 Tax=Falsihalocynthiibacter TaxID=2854182 RepID=UPI0030039F0D